MNPDQADELRNLVRSQTRHGASGEAPVRLIAVTGGQRGVGTTTIALNLAVSLAIQGQRTILVDADLDRGAIAPLCGLAERGSIVDVLASRRTIHEVLARGPAGIQVLPGVWAPHEANNCSAAAQGRMIARLKALGAYADVIVVDTGSQRNSFVRRFWQAADVPLVVTTPEAGRHHGLLCHDQSAAGRRRVDCPPTRWSIGPSMRAAPRKSRSESRPPVGDFWACGRLRPGTCPRIAWCKTRPRCVRPLCSVRHNRKPLVRWSNLAKLSGSSATASLGQTNAATYGPLEPDQKNQRHRLPVPRWCKTR